MSQRYSLFPQCAVMFLDYSLCSTVSESELYSLCQCQFMSLYSLCPKSTVYFLREQFMSLYNSLCPKSTVYVPIVQFMYFKVVFMSSSIELYSQEYSLCP